MIDPVTLDSRRRSGVLVPLFSCRSSVSWGIGEIGDLVPFAQWLAGGGQDVLQLLPINEMAPGQQSPYSALSAMAIDPIYVRMAAVQEFAALGGEASFDRIDRDRLRDVSASPRVDYIGARHVKQHALALAFARFYEREWRAGTARADAFEVFAKAEAWWLNDYALFRAMHAHGGEQCWMNWDAGWRACDAGSLARARQELEREVLFHQYVQWIASAQWQETRHLVRGEGVELFGDLPFMVDRDSADVWSRQHLFRMDVSLGVPPDAFSATGQDWGMPLYDWDAMAADDFRWLRDRARRTADLFDGCRVDHLVGFYRTYGRPLDGGPPFFTPAEQPQQEKLGERVLHLLGESGAEIIAEDLGVVPDFVRASLARLGVPGFRVLRWARYWHEDGQPFRDPSEYEAVSVATSGTHDTETLAVWWEALPADDRRLVEALPTLTRIGGEVDLATAAYLPFVRDALLEALFASGSDLVILPIQDVFGWRDRINEPATVTPANWTFCLPWPCDHFDEQAEARGCQARLREWSRAYARGLVP